MIAAIALVVAYLLSPDFDNLILNVVFASLSVLLFIALLTFRQQQGWNLALLLGFAVSLGVVFSLFPSGSKQVEVLTPLRILLPCLVISMAVGRLMAGRFTEVGEILWIVLWAYLLGWAALILLSLDPIFYLTWSVVGVLLFSGLAAIWSADMEAQLNNQANVSAAIDLYLICINLYIAALILGTTLV